MATLFTPPRYTPVDGNGATYPGAKLYFYTTGTSTPKDTYSDSGLGTPNANPVVADANGLFGSIYLAAGDYKAILKTSADVTVWTVDPQSGIGGGDTLTTRGDILTRDATTFKRLPLGTVGQVLASNGTDILWSDPTGTGIPGRTQTVQGGPVTTAGLADFLPATDANLDLGSQNITSSYPLVVVSANGFSSGGPNGRVGRSTANLTWTGLTASRAATAPNFLYVTVNGDGTLTTGFTIVAPVYQWGGTPATTSGLFTFNISEMKGYLGNGSTAPQTHVVFVGEAATDGSSVISTVAYAYNGKYDSGYTATLVAGGTAVAKNHNIGVLPGNIDYRIQNTTTDAGWAVGEEIGLSTMTGYNGASDTVPVLGTGTKTMTLQTSGAPYYVLSKSAGTSTALTLANWKYRFIADRGW